MQVALVGTFWHKLMRIRSSTFRTLFQVNRFPKHSRQLPCRPDKVCRRQASLRSPGLRMLLRQVSASQMARTTTRSTSQRISTEYVVNGDIGDYTAFAIAPNAPLNVGSAAQFSENTFVTNLDPRSYNGLLFSLQKNLSHALHYDFNYTLAHSIDNISFFANSQGDTGVGGVGLVCDVVRPRECRSNSDFDVKQYIAADAYYELPFGRKRMLLSDAPFWLNQIVGDSEPQRS